MKKIDNNTYIVRGNTVLRMKNERKKAKGKTTPTPSKGGESHSAAKINDSSELGNEGWCDWGDDNQYPKTLMEKASKIGAAVGGLEVLCSAHYGAGLKIYELHETQQGDAIFQEKIPSSVPEIYDFFDRTQFELTISDIIADYETFGVAFVEYLLSPNGQEIISVVRQQASYCRFEKPKNGIINNVIINTAWGETDFDVKQNVKVPCFSQFLSVQEIKDYCQQKNIRKFIIPIINTLLIEKVYPSVGWHSSLKSGWMDVVVPPDDYEAEYQAIDEMEQLALKIASRMRFDSNNTGHFLYGAFQKNTLEIRPVELEGDGIFGVEVSFALSSKQSLKLSPDDWKDIDKVC